MTPEARKALWQRDRVLFCRFARGRSIGYVRRIKFGTWFARVKLKSGRMRQQRIGIADDDKKADGQDRLSFAQALKAAEDWCGEQSAEAIDEHLAWEKETEYPPLPNSPPYLVGHALKAYLEWYKENRKGFSSAYYTSRSALFEYFWDMPFSDLTSTSIRRWMFQQSNLPPRIRTKNGEKQNYHPSLEGDFDFVRRRRASVNRYLHILRAALYQGLERGMVGNDAAWISVRGYRGVSRVKVNFLEIDEISKLIANCPPDLAQLVTGAVLTGCRLGELRRMTVGALLLEKRLLQIDDMKTHQIRNVFLSKEAMEFFEGLTLGRRVEAPMFRTKNGLPWRKGSQWRPFKRACSKANLSPSFRFHELRHTYASHAVMSGVPLKVVATQLGHSDTRTVDRFYSRLGNEYVAEVIEEKMPLLLSTQ